MTAPIEVQQFPGRIEPLVAVRFTGGRYNGFQGTVIKSCDDWCSVLIVFHDGNPSQEVVEEFRHLMPLADWLLTKSATERALKGNPT